MNNVSNTSSKYNNKSKNKINNKNNKSSKNYIKSNKINNFKVVYIIIIIFILLFSFSYAFFNYTKVGDINKLIVGNIYMHYNTKEMISLYDAEPRNTQDENAYIEFNISGVNEYSKDIIYEIDLLYGLPEGKSEENRIRDDLLRFSLVQKINDNEKIIIDNAKYDDINNLRIYVDRILNGTTNEVIHNYKLYMWISDEIKVGNSEDDDYSISEWNNLFASIKVRVIGDFEEKETNKLIKVNFDSMGGNTNISYKYYDIGDIYGTLPIPIREGYEFNGWYYGSKKILENDFVTINGSSFISNGDIILDGTNYIDTGMYPFSRDNWDKNFYVTFKIKEKASNQTSQATIVNAKLEIEYRGYPGFLFRKTTGNTNYYEVSASTDSNNIRRISNIPDTVEKVTFLRINNKLYYSIDDDYFIEVLDFTNFDNYFDVPLTIGASLDSELKPFRYFAGTISDFKAQYLDNEATIDNYLNHFLYDNDKEITLQASWSKSKVYYDGEYTFDGTNYIDTGIYLFSEKNWQRNFYMSFEILENNSIDTMATPMSSKNESGSPFPGVEFRLEGKLTSYRSKASKSNGSSKDITNIPVSTTRKVEYLRIDNILYYNIDSKTNGNFVKMLDFTGFNLYFDVPVTFGASITRPGGTPWRYFIGKLSNMKVEFIDDSELSIYRSMLD